MTFEQNKTYTFKLNSGEEFIAKVTDIFTEEHTITITDSVSICS
jgi:predicted DNA-binding protein with PD1-like motif